MEAINIDTIIEKLPEPLKDVGKKYMLNNKHIRKTMEIVLDRKLDDDEKTIPKYQSIDQSKLVPLMVKTIQELEARIKTLEDA